MNGLSNAGFMGGLMQGAQFAEGMQNRSHALGLADERQRMRKEEHGQKTELNQQNIDAGNQQVLLNDLDRDLRVMDETGKLFTKEQSKKYKSLGFDKLNNENWRKDNQDAGAWMHKGMTTGEWNENALGSMDTLYRGEYRKREKADGLKRRTIGVQELKDGRMIPILELTRKDGSKYEAPLTMKGTPDGDDNLFLLDETKMNEMYEVQMNRADMAYAMDKAGGDPRKVSQVMRNIAFGKGKAASPELETIYDEKTGRDQKGYFDKNNRFIPVGGNKALAPGKNRSGAGGSSDQNKNFIKSIENYQNKMAPLIVEGNAKAIEGMNALFESTTGFKLDDITKAMSYKREVLGDNSQLTHEEFNKYTQVKNNSGARSDVNQIVDTDSSLFGSFKPTEEVAEAEAPQGMQGQQQEPQSIASSNGLSDVDVIGGMPRFTPEQRQHMNEIRQSKSQAKERLMTELNTIRSTLSKGGRRTPTKREASLMGAMREIDGANDIDSLNSIIAKIKLGNGSQKPGIKDAAHMAAL
jgi:hypothetical protein